MVDSVAAGILLGNEKLKASLHSNMTKLTSEKRKKKKTATTSLATSAGGTDHVHLAADDHFEPVRPDPATDLRQILTKKKSSSSKTKPITSTSSGEEQVERIPVRTRKDHATIATTPTRSVVKKKKKKSSSKITANSKSTTKPSSENENNIHHSTPASSSAALTNTSAIKIQSLVRGHQARQLLLHSSNSAILIQSLIRGHLTRKRIAKYKPIWKQQQSLNAKLYATRQDVVKRERDLRLFSVMSASRVKSYDQECEAKAAILIQRLVRGWRARRRVEAIRAAEREKKGRRRKQIIHEEAGDHQEQMNEEDHHRKSSTLASEEIVSLINAKWGVADLDRENVVGGGVCTTTLHHSTLLTQEHIDQTTQRMIERLYLEQQRRATALAQKQRESRFNSSTSSTETEEQRLAKFIGTGRTNDDPNSLKSRIAQASRLLDAYYDEETDLGMLGFHDLSLGCHRVRRETDLYASAIQGK